MFRADIDPQLGLTPATSSAAARQQAERAVAAGADGTAPGVKADVWWVVRARVGRCAELHERETHTHSHTQTAYNIFAL